MLQRGGGPLDEPNIVERRLEVSGVDLMTDGVTRSLMLQNCSNSEARRVFGLAALSERNVGGVSTGKGRSKLDMLSLCS